MPSRTATTTATIKSTTLVSIRGSRSLATCVSTSSAETLAATAARWMTTGRRAVMVGTFEAASGRIAVGDDEWGFAGIVSPSCSLDCCGARSDERLSVIARLV